MNAKCHRRKHEGERQDAARFTHGPVAGIICPLAHAESRNQRDPRGQRFWILPSVLTTTSIGRMWDTSVSVS